MYNFDFVEPKTLKAAEKALAGDDAQALAGGQTLLPTMKQRLAAPATLVRLTSVPGLSGVQKTDGKLVIGATTTHADVAAAATDYPALAAMAGSIGDPAVRNRGTIGGSLANNDPSACYPAAVLASNATIKTNKREIPADDYFVGLFETTLDEGEFIVSASFPIPDVANYQKFVQPASRFALVGVFVAKFGDDIRIAVTGAAQDGVFRWHEVEAEVSDCFSEAVVPTKGIDPAELISDLHGTQAYRANLISVLTKRAVKACKP